MVRNESGGARHQETDDCGHRKNLEKHFPLRRCANIAVVRGRNWGAPSRQYGARMMAIDCCEADTPQPIAVTANCAEAHRESIQGLNPVGDALSAGHRELGNLDG